MGWFSPAAGITLKIQQYCKDNQPSMKLTQFYKYNYLQKDIEGGVSAVAYSRQLKNFTLAANSLVKVSFRPSYLPV